MKTLMNLAVLAVLAMPLPGMSQTVPPYRPGLPVAGDNPAPTRARCWSGAIWVECGVAQRESVMLAAANTPSASFTVYGGDYVFLQTCSAYGTLTLRQLGPDGTTWMTLLTKTASDTAGGTGVSLGAGAVVSVTVTATTGCNASLSRVPG